MTTHITDVVYSYGSRVIQRCARCGEKLIDIPELTIKSTNVADTQEYFWSVGCYVREHDSGIWEIVSDATLGPLPDDICQPFDF